MNTLFEYIKLINKREVFIKCYAEMKRNIGELTVDLNVIKANYLISISNKPLTEDNIKKVMYQCTKIYSNNE